MLTVLGESTPTTPQGGQGERFELYNHVTKQATEPGEEEEEEEEEEEALYQWGGGRPALRHISL